MSHKTSIKLELNNKKYLLKALDNLNIKYTEAKGEELKTQGRYGVHEEVDIRIESQGNNSFNGAIGFKKTNDGKYTAVGDFYGLKDSNNRMLTEERLKSEVTSHSKEAEVVDRLSNMTFEIDPSSRTETEEEISFTMERWV